MTHRILLVSFPRSGTKSLQTRIASLLGPDQLRLVDTPHMAEALTAGIHSRRQLSSSYDLSRLEHMRLTDYDKDNGSFVDEDDLSRSDHFRVGYSRLPEQSVFSPVLFHSSEDRLADYSKYRAVLTLTDVRDTDTFVLKFFPSLASKETCQYVFQWARSHNTTVVVVERSDLESLAYSYLHAILSNNILPGGVRRKVTVPMGLLSRLRMEYSVFRQATRGYFREDSYAWGRIGEHLNLDLGYPAEAKEASASSREDLFVPLGTEQKTELQTFLTEFQ